MFWDFLYQLNQRDLQFPQVVLGQQQGNDSGLKTPCTVDFFTVPEDQVGLVLHASVVPTPAAATTVVRTVIEAFNPTATRTITHYLRDYLTPGAGVTSVDTMKGVQSMFLVPPGWRCRGKADYSAITGNNQLQCECLWLFLPRGNFSLP
jgi:hypothetical protein